MQTLTNEEIKSVGAGLYDGNCNLELASYVVATAGVAVTAGPVGWGLFALGWAFAAKSMHRCASENITS
jgi:hypothetical protein